MCVYVIKHPIEKIITEGEESFLDSNYTKLFKLAYPQMALCCPTYMLREESFITLAHSLESKKIRIWFLITLILHRPCKLRKLLTAETV